MLLFLTNLITNILAKLLPMFIKSSKPKMTKSAKPGKTEKKIKEKLKKDGWIVCLFLVIFIFVGGCGWSTRVIFIEPGKSVQLGETIKDVRVWVLDENGERVPGKGDLKEGGFYVPHYKSDESDDDE